MFRSVFLKTLYDKRWFLFGWTLGALVLFNLTTVFYPAVADSIDDLVKSIPPALQGVVGSVSAYQTYAGYIGSAVFGSQGIMYFVPLAIILGLSLGSGDELSRRLYQLLAQPISRQSVVLQKWLAGLVLLLVIVTSVYGSLVAVSLLIGETVPHEALLRMSAMSYLYTVTLFTLTYSIAVAWAKRGLAIAITAGWALGSLLIYTLAPQVKWVKDIDWLSAMKYYDTPRFVDQAIEIRDVAVLMIVCIVVIIVALINFSRRDLRDDAS
jgi:ABC-2 type transport system permease protein